MAFARPFAVADMVFEANLEFPGRNVYFGQIIIAGPQRIQLFDHVHDRPNRLETRIRAKIFGAVLNHVPGVENARKRFILDANPRVTFVVLEQDIVARLEFFDQVVLKQQGVVFCWHDDVFDRHDFAHHDVRPAGFVHFVEIRRYALFEIFRLADVEDFAVLVKILVDSRIIGKRLYL